MKQILAMITLLALPACATAGQTAHSTHAAYRCTTVDWLEPGKPILRARLNGRKLVFLVDTGAEYDGWIKRDLALELGLPIVGEIPLEREGDPTGGLPFYGVSDLTLGTISFANRRFGEMPQVGSKPQVFDGIIGNGLFADMQAAFDYQRNQLQVTDLNLVTGEVVEFDRYGIPVIPLQIGTEKVTVHLDTGNMASKLFVKATDVERLALADNPVERGRAVTVSGAFSVMEATLADKVLYGTTRLAIDKVRWPGAYDEGQLGSQGLAGQTLRVDWRNKRVSIRPEPAPTVCPTNDDTK